MSLPVVLRPEAQDDLLAARDWYERQRAGLGDILVSAFDNADQFEAEVARLKSRSSSKRRTNGRGGKAGK